VGRGGGRRNGRDGKRGLPVVVGPQFDPLEPEPRQPPPPTGPVNVEAYLATSLGTPRWLERLQDIEGEEFRVLCELRRAWLELAEDAGEAAGGGEGFAAAWRARASRFDLSALNRMIAQHNDYFPIERKLPFDVRTGDYRAPWGIPWRRARRDAEWIIGHFPAEVEAARAELARS